MTLRDALRKAIAIVRDETRAAYLEAGSSRYRLIPDEQHPNGYTIHLSIRYNDEWQPWGQVGKFGVDDVLCDKWLVVCATPLLRDALPDLRVGDEAYLEVRGEHLCAVTATREVGCDTGRRRYRVVCRTCRVVVHPATTGPREQMDMHVFHVENDGRPTPFPGTSPGVVE